MSIASLRASVSALVEQEGKLLSQAFELSRSGSRGEVDALFAQVQAIQVRRNGLTKQIGSILGAQRMHVASEVWKPGVYDYGPEVGAPKVRVRVESGPLGMQVLFPDQDAAVHIETLVGTFDGPLAVDDAATHRERPGPRRSAARPARREPAPARTATRPLTPRAK